MQCALVCFSPLLKRGRSTFSAVVGHGEGIDVLVNWTNLLIERSWMMSFNMRDQSDA